MPELPEVEQVVQDIRPHLVGQTIKDVDIFLERLIKTSSGQEFARILENRRIDAVERRGKYILIRLEEGWTLIVHLRMTGGLVWCSLGSEDEKYERLRFCLADGSILSYSDSRTLGTLHLLPDHALGEIKGLTTLGPEPLSEEFSKAYLKSSVTDKKGSIKGLLLDQAVIAGLGNIYVDESLFRSGIRPERTAGSLKKKEIDLLHQEIQAVIVEVIHQGGTTFRDYRKGRGEQGEYQQRLKVYGRTGKPCVICGRDIQKSRVAGRGTHYCDHCQK